MMDVPDSCFVTNRDWDPGYLSEIMLCDWYEFDDHWKSNVTDQDIVDGMKYLSVDKYSPVIEDISLDDETLSKEVDRVEYE